MKTRNSFFSFVALLMLPGILVFYRCRPYFIFFTLTALFLVFPLALTFFCLSFLKMSNILHLCTVFLSVLYNRPTAFVCCNNVAV